MHLYQHTQPGHLMRIVLGAALILMVGIAISIGSHPAAYGFEFGSMLMILCLGLFHSLSVNITKESLTVAFGPGVIRKQFALTDIEAASQVRNHWFYGWGIRLTPRGWMYNVSGYDAVELQFKNGKRFRIGTDDPRGLLDALGC